MFVIVYTFFYCVDSRKQHQTEITIEAPSIRPRLTSRNELLKVFLSLIYLLGEATVKIEVGSGTGKKTFTLHKKILCDNIPYFDKMFNGGFKEGQSQSATMPEDNPDAFLMILAWVYTNRIEVFTRRSSKGRDIILSAHYIRLFGLAEIYNTIRLADDTMDALAERSAALNTILSPYHLRLCYELTHPESNLRLFASRQLAWNISHFPEDRMATLDSNSIYNVMVEVPDLGKAVLLHSRNQGTSVIPDPRKSPACDYHQHAKMDQCPNSQ